MDEVVFCGQLISEGKRKPNPAKIDAVKNLSSPRNKKEAQSLFGLFNYHRTFIENFASKSAAITQSYRGKEFNWTWKSETAMNMLKKEMKRMVKIVLNRQRHLNIGINKIIIFYPYDSV